MHYINEVIKLSLVAIHETASERVPDRGGAQPLQIILPTNGIRLLVLGLHHALRSEDFQSLIVPVRAIARRVDCPESPWRKMESHSDRVVVLDRFDLRDVCISQDWNL